MNKAIILAGGKGTRLSPLTDGLPKPLVPFLGKSLIERIIDKLSAAGIGEAMISTMYLSEKIRSTVGSEYSGVKIKYLEETYPLGTAGGLRYARELLSLEKDESFLVISGDCVCDFDLQAVFAHHEKSGADATIVTTECDSPLEYGIVISDAGGMICGFNEKPPWSQVNGTRVNTGIYIIKSHVIDMIPQGAYDFSADLFPKMLADGMKLAEYAAGGYWCDIGNIESYYKCCIDALDNRIPGFCPDGIKNFVRDGVKLVGACRIDESAKVENGTEIGPNTVIGKECFVGKNSEIAGSIIHDGVKIADGCRIEGAIICSGAVIGTRCNICGGTVIASGAVIPDGSYLPSNSRITSGGSTGSKKSESKKYFSPETELCAGEDGIRLGNAAEHPYSGSEHTADKIGSAISMAVGKGGRIGIMYDGTPAARIYSGLLTGGLEDGEAKILDFGKGFEKLAKYMSVFITADCFIFVRTESKSGDVYASLYNRNALPPSHDFERRLQRAYYSKSYEKRGNFNPHYRENVENASAYYYCELIDNAKAYLGSSLFDGMKAAFVCENKSDTSTGESDGRCAEFDMLKKCFEELGGICIDKKDAEEQSAIMVIYNSERGVSLSQSNYSLDRYHLTAAVIEREKRCGRCSFAMPYVSPERYSAIIGKGADILLYPTYSGKRFVIPRELVRSCYWMTDDIMLAARSLSLVCSEHKNISEFFAASPQFSFREKTVVLPDGTAAAKTVVIKKLSRSEGSGFARDGYEGIKISYPEGNVTVVPGKSGLFKIYSEAMNSEFADMLCDRTEKEILEATDSKEKK